MNRALCDLHRVQQSRLVYVDCGARGDSSNPLVDSVPGAIYAGFEADERECERLRKNAKDNYRYFPVAAAGQEGTETLYITENPACSSLLKPDETFWGRFLDCAPQIRIRSACPVRTVTLDRYLPEVGIEHADFLELDTQGTELHVLRGAERCLESHLLGLRVEVEFSPMYLEQPLFSDLDPFVRSKGFALFDLSRHRYRRRAYPRRLPTRGQLLFGHALYLKGFEALSGGNARHAAVKLCLIADHYGIHDYSYEIVEQMLGGRWGEPSVPEARMLEEAIAECQAPRPWPGSRVSKAVLAAQRLGIESRLGGLARFCRHFSDVYSFLVENRSPTWKD